MLAARNFSAARQCLRSVRITPSFVTPVSQVPAIREEKKNAKTTLANTRLPLRQIRFASTTSEDAVAKFKGQKGSDVRVLPPNLVPPPQYRSQPRNARQGAILPATNKHDAQENRLINWFEI